MFYVGWSEQHVEDFVLAMYMFPNSLICCKGFSEEKNRNTDEIDLTKRLALKLFNEMKQIRENNIQEDYRN